MHKIPHHLGAVSSLRMQALLLQCLLGIRYRLLPFLYDFSAAFLDFFGTFAGYGLRLYSK